MRDFRDAKAMAQTLRESLTTKTVTISHGESLELVSKMLGVADWNTLSALLQSDRRPAAGRPAARERLEAARYPAVPLRDMPHAMLYRRETRLPKQQRMRIGLPMLLLTTLRVEEPDFMQLFHDVTWKGWSALAFAAIGASLIAHTGYFHLVQRYPVTSVAPLTTLSPVFSVIFGVTLLGDPLSTQILLGGACTLVGVVIITVREKRIVDTGS